MKNNFLSTKIPIPKSATRLLFWGTPAFHPDFDGLLACMTFHMNLTVTLSA
jgi:hypothetical protein